MNIEYLNTLPEVENKYNINLKDGEKVVFTAMPSCFGTELGVMLSGFNPTVTLTNKRLIADNQVGLWTVDIAKDIFSCSEVEGGKFIFKYDYILVKLNKTIIYNNGKQKLNGFQFYFDKEDTEKFKDIMNHVLR